MKSIIVSAVLFSCIQLCIQAEHTQLNLSKSPSTDLARTYKVLKHILTETAFDVISPRNIKNAHPDGFSISTNNLRNCNYTQIEEDVSGLTNVTVGLAANVSEALEGILDKCNECASESFPKSLSCFLGLVGTCQADIKEIKDAVAAYAPVAHSLVVAIFKDIVSCY